MKWENEFPYIYLEKVDETNLPAGIHLAVNQQMDNAFAGLLFSTPLAGFGLLNILGFAVLLVKPGYQRLVRERKATTTQLIGIGSLICGFFAQAGVDMAWFYASGRFLMDFTPFLLIIAIVGIWMIHTWLEEKPAWQDLLWSVVSIVVGFTVVLGLFGALSYYWRIQWDLVDQLTKNVDRFSALISEISHNFSKVAQLISQIFTH
jgi:putative effector of murein hydrolase LrgA (UPF0299 family)